MICKNCGKPLIIQNGICLYCGAKPNGEDCSNSAHNNSIKEKGYHQIKNNDDSQNKKEREKCSIVTPNKVLQYLILVILLAVIVPVSNAECNTENGLWWGIATIYCVNGSAIIWSIITIIHATRGYFSNRERTWKLYYEWIHFPIEIIFVLIGYIVLYNYEETWILLLNLLTGTWPIVGAHCIEKTAGYNQWEF